MKRIIIALTIIILIFSACKHKTMPKPMAYFRISFPAHKYQTYNTDTCPYTFEYPVYSNISLAKDIEYHRCWININFPQYKAHIHITLRKVDNNLDSLLEDSHTLVYKHVVKADAIEAKDYINDSLHVFATMFNIEGNAASPLEFRITDSTHYFIHGSLYFRVRPNADSLAPAVDFIKIDVKHLIETFKWKYLHTNACF
jgi:gliding motility-associated lipoprotein GldD